MTIQEKLKLVSEFDGLQVEIGYENKTTGHTEYVLRGRRVIELRQSGLIRGGYKESAMFSEVQYHENWQWQIPVWSKLCKKAKHDIMFQYCHKYWATIENDDKEAGFEIIVSIIQRINS